jgi:hypothetical protein
LITNSSSYLSDHRNRAELFQSNCSWPDQRTSSGNYGCKLCGKKWFRDDLSINRGIGGIGEVDGVCHDQLFDGGDDFGRVMISLAARFGRALLREPLRQRGLKIKRYPRWPSEDLTDEAMKTLVDALKRTGI